MPRAGPEGRELARLRERGQGRQEHPARPVCAPETLDQPFRCDCVRQGIRLASAHPGYQNRAFREAPGALMFPHMFPHHPHTSSIQNQNGAQTINQDKYVQDTIELAGYVAAFLAADVYDPARTGLIEKIKREGNKWVRHKTGADAGLAEIELPHARSSACIAHGNGGARLETKRHYSVLPCVVAVPDACLPPPLPLLASFAVGPVRPGWLPEARVGPRLLQLPPAASGVRFDYLPTILHFSSHAKHLPPSVQKSPVFPQA